MLQNSGDIYHPKWTPAHSIRPRWCFWGWPTRRGPCWGVGPDRVPLVLEMGPGWLAVAEKRHPAAHSSGAEGLLARLGDTRDLSIQVEEGLVSLGNGLFVELSDRLSVQVVDKPGYHDWCGMAGMRRGG